MCELYLVHSRFLFSAIFGHFYFCFFTDKNFPPNDSSLGPLKTDKSSIVWIRMGDVNTGSTDPNKRMQLFSTGLLNYITLIL